jgi:hypothetical protein
MLKASTAKPEAWVKERRIRAVGAVRSCIPYTKAIAREQVSGTNLIHDTKVQNEFFHPP